MPRTASDGDMPGAKPVGARIRHTLNCAPGNGRMGIGINTIPAGCAHDLSPKPNPISQLFVVRESRNARHADGCGGRHTAS